LKTLRQKSEYLGKNHWPDKNGQGKKVKEAFSCGELLPALKILSDCRLDEFLPNNLVKERVACVIAIGLARLLRGLSLNHAQDWHEGTWFFHENVGLPLSSFGVS
jgi:hypothetical protein